MYLEVSAKVKFFRFFPFTFHFLIHFPHFVWVTQIFFTNSTKFLPLNLLIKITEGTFASWECVIWQNYNNIMEAITLVKDNWAKNFGSWTFAQLHSQRFMLVQRHHFSSQQAQKRGENTTKLVSTRSTSFAQFPHTFASLVGKSSSFILRHTARDLLPREPKAVFILFAVYAFQGKV